MVDIILKDGQGNPVEYKGISKITLPATDGSLVTFSEGISEETNSGSVNLENAIVIKKTRVDELNSLFTNNDKITEVTVGTLNKAEANFMFSNCSSLEKIEFINFNFTEASEMFSGCSSLKAIILRSVNINDCTAYDIIGGCYHFTGYKDVEFNHDGLQDGYFYVPRANVQSFENFLSSNECGYASNQVRALEDYTVDGTTTGAMDEEKMNKKEGYEVRLLVDSADWNTLNGLIYYSTVDDYSSWNDIPVYDSSDFNEEDYYVLLKGVKQIKFRYTEGAYIDCEELGLHVVNLDNPYSEYDDTEMFTLTEDIHLTLREATEDDLEPEDTSNGYKVYFNRGTEISRGQVFYSIDGKETWHEMGSIFGDSGEYYFDEIEGVHLVLENVTQIAFRIESCFISADWPAIEELSADAGEFGGTAETVNYILDSNITMFAREYYPPDED